MIKPNATKLLTQRRSHRISETFAWNSRKASRCRRRPACQAILETRRLCPFWSWGMGEPPIAQQDQGSCSSSTVRP